MTLFSRDQHRVSVHRQIQQHTEQGLAHIEYLLRSVKELQDEHFIFPSQTSLPDELDRIAQWEAQTEALIDLGKAVGVPLTANTLAGTLATMRNVRHRLNTDYLRYLNREEGSP